MILYKGSAETGKKPGAHFPSHWNFHQTNILPYLKQKNGAERILKNMDLFTDQIKK